MEEIITTTIKGDEPVCYLVWKGNNNQGRITFTLCRDFNWFQRKMLKWCFGLEYEKA